MENAGELPFPFDQGRVVRTANLRRARRVYFDLFEQAKKLAATEQARRPASNTQTEYIDPLDLSVIAVQPLLPTNKIIPARDIQAQIESLRISSGAGFSLRRDSPIPGGIAYKDFNIAYNRRSAQILFDNGMVSNFGPAHFPRRDNFPRLSIGNLIRRLVTTVHVAQGIYIAASCNADVALVITLENLGEYAVEPLINTDWDLPRDEATLLSGWRWDYLIPASIISERVRLDSLCIDIIQELCWAFGDIGANSNYLKSIAAQLELTLSIENQIQ